MVAPKFRSRSQRKVYRKTPGGKVVVQFKPRKAAKAQCAQCKAFLKGVPQGGTAMMRSLAKTQRRPERPYGGVLCTKCMRKTMIERARKLVA
jgi:large subunit ribosomal protein L34e